MDNFNAFLEVASKSEIRFQLGKLSLKARRALQKELEALDRIETYGKLSGRDLANLPRKLVWEVQMHKATQRLHIIRSETSSLQEKQLEKTEKNFGQLIQLHQELDKKQDVPI